MQVSVAVVIRHVYIPILVPASRPIAVKLDLISNIIV